MRSERVLISLKTYIGDAVMSSPMIQAVESQYQEVEIQTSPVVQQLLQDPLRSRCFLPFVKSRSPWATVQSAVALRQKRFEVAILVNRSFRAALVTALAGIRVRVGHAKEGRGALVNRVVPYNDDRFEAETCLDLARAVGCEGSALPRLAVTEEEFAFGRDTLEGESIGIQPGTRYESKQIPLSVLGEVAVQLNEEGHRLVLLGGKDELEVSRQFEGSLPFRVQNLTGATDIRQTLGVMSNLKAVVGGDTGLMHMAVGCACPTTTAFGPTNASKWGHHYPPHHVVLAPDKDMSKLTAEMLLEPIRSTFVSY